VSTFDENVSKFDENMLTVMTICENWWNGYSRQILWLTFSSFWIVRAQHILTAVMPQFMLAFNIRAQKSELFFADTQ
jgi:hypothetical protein